MESFRQRDENSLDLRRRRTDGEEGEGESKEQEEGGAEGHWGGREKK